MNHNFSRALMRANGLMRWDSRISKRNKAVLSCEKQQYLRKAGGKLMYHSKAKWAKWPICITFCLGAILALTSCAPKHSDAGRDAGTTSEQAKTTLDLRDKGLTDVSDLLKETQLTSIDLRGNEITAADFDALKAALPNCEILWSVPLGDTRYDSNSTTLTLDAATDDLGDALAYFPDLESVQLAAAPDDAVAKDLAARYPNIALLWDVTLGGETYAPDTQTLDLSGKAVDLAELTTKLQGLANLKSVVFGEETFALADQIALANAYPKIAFVWNVQLLEDFAVRSDVTDLDLRKYTVPDAAAFSDALVLFPKLKMLDMCGSGPSDEEMAAIRARYPQVKVVWYIHIYNWVIRTDIKGFSTGNRSRFPNGGGRYVPDGKLFSYHKIHAKDLEVLKYCTDLIALDIGHCTRVGNIDFLKYQPKLQYLDIALCNLEDISVLENMHDLVYLQMMYNYIADASPIKNNTKLRYVNASNNILTSADVFTTLPKLERLFINCSGLSDEQIASLTSTLTEKLPNIVIKASQDNPEYAMSAWCPGNEGYVQQQAIFGMRAKGN